MDRIERSRPQAGDQQAIADREQSRPIQWLAISAQAILSRSPAAKRALHVFLRDTLELILRRAYRPCLWSFHLKTGVTPLLLDGLILKLALEVQRPYRPSIGAAPPRGTARVFGGRKTLALRVKGRLSREFSSRCQHRLASIRLKRSVLA